VVDNRPTFAEYVGATAEPSLLPDWYLPPPMGRRTLLTGWKRRAALTTVVAFVAINAFGLCSTYGHIVFA